MKKLKIFAALFLLQSNVVSASALEYSLGGEWYKETYREYSHGTERFMQQRGNLWSFTGFAQYHFNEQHSVKVDGRYSRGSTTYTGGLMGNAKNPQGTPYGSVTKKGMPRDSFDIRLNYQYKLPIDSKIAAFIESGLGYRELNDRGAKVQSYDRKNKLVYAHLGIGLNIPLEFGYEFNPSIAYNQVIRGKQYSYVHPTIVHKQRNGKGIELDLLIAKRFPNNTKLVVGPFYRGWKIFDSDKVFDSKGGTLEPKNYTHEAGVKLSYIF